MGKILEIKATDLAARVADCPTKIVCQEGGAGSGKTIGTLQAILANTFAEPQALTTITRETYGNLERGPIRDWERVLDWSDATHLFKRNKSTHVWTNEQSGHRVEFLALDDEQKARGPRRQNLFMNEANEIPLDTARQLMRRTSGRIWLDWNPSLIKWWVDTEILTREDCTLFNSTYKDNPYLEPDERDEIEASVPVYREADGTEVKDWTLTYSGDGTLVRGDPYEWGVYGLGRRGSPSEAIYQFVYDAEMPERLETVVGIDFGYEHPTSVCRVARVDRDPVPALYVDQLLHMSGLTIADLIERLPDIGVKAHDTLVCDNSRPEAIREIEEAGYNAIACQKGAGSVIEGIDWIKRHELYFTARSVLAKQQFQNYRRKKIRGEVQEEPVKHEDDAPDAVRYAAYDTWGRPAAGFGFYGG